MLLLDHVRYNYKMYQQFNVIGDHPLIPAEAFLYFPTMKGEAQNDDFKLHGGAVMRRLIFEGGIADKYTAHEQEALKKLDEYLLRKGKSLDRRWDISWRMRFIQAASYDIKQTVKDMDIYMEYKNKSERVEETDIVRKTLAQGMLYVCGRDAKYRPILVFDIKKIIDSKITEKDLLQTLTYLLEFVTGNMLIPGQVENWVVIIDVGYESLMWMVSPAKICISFLSSTFKARMFAAYVVRCPTSINFIWGIAKKFLREETINKINFLDQEIGPLLQYCNPEQLEVKYGGKATNFHEEKIEQPFWPPRARSNNYQHQKVEATLISKSEYSKRYHEQLLRQRKIYAPFIAQPANNQPRSMRTELRVNPQLELLLQLDSEFSNKLSAFAEHQKRVDSVNEAMSKVNQSMNREPKLTFANCFTNHKHS